MSVRIAHLSDIHFGGENPAAVLASLDYVRRTGPDITVISGDLTVAGEPHEFVWARAFVDALPSPTLVVPGNHDTPYFDIAKRITQPWRRHEAAFGELEPRQSGPGYAICGLNSARGAQVRFDWSKGAMDRRQAKDAAAWFDGFAPQVLRIVTCHHPLVESLGEPMSGDVHGGQKAAEVLAEASVDLVLTGHVHAPFVLSYPYGDGRTYAVGAGTLSTRERGCPAGFNMIEAQGSDIQITALGWTGTTFEPWRTWAITRRKVPVSA